MPCKEEGEAKEEEEEEEEEEDEGEDEGGREEAREGGREKRLAFRCQGPWRKRREERCV